MNRHRRKVLCAGGACLAWLGLRGRSAFAEQPILILRNPRLGGDRGEIRFTRRDLEAMNWHEVQTGNQFITGQGRFRGPRFVEVLSLIGHAGATRVRLLSAGGDISEIGFAELARYDPILAMEMDGRALTLRDFGPVWVMYPIDDHPELRDSRYNNRLVWQLQVVELF